MREVPDPALASSRTALRVRFCETDMMGVVHHANYLVYCEAARVDWLHRRGVSYADWERLGIHLPVVEASLRFRQPARFEDEIAVATALTELTRVTARFRYVISRGEHALVEAETLLACVGANLAARRMPEAVLRVFRSGEQR